MFIKLGRDPSKEYPHKMKQIHAVFFRDQVENVKKFT